MKDAAVKNLYKGASRTYFASRRSPKDDSDRLEQREEVSKVTSIDDLPPEKNLKDFKEEEIPREKEAEKTNIINEGQEESQERQED